MKIDKSTTVSFILLIVIASLYRVLPGRPLGFAPQIAMALFGGAVIKDKKLSFLLPLLSMFISDLIYQFLYKNGLCSLPGFYNGQLTNYLLFAGITIIGFWIKKENILSIFVGSVIGATAYFFASNFLVWAFGGLNISNIPYPKSFVGIIDCYTAALPFYKGSLMATLIFSTVLFGGYYVIKEYGNKRMITT